jgi:transcriptional regulator with XRE-family HTH domain
MKNATGSEQNRPMEPADTAAMNRLPIEADVNIGLRVRQLRVERGMSMRALAEASGLSVNTLSLIENGKNSPSVSTLQRAAAALGISITTLFENPAPSSSIVFTPAANRGSAHYAHGKVEDLAAGFVDHALHPYLVTLNPQSDSGTDPIVHTGYEFVLCLQGRIDYTVGHTRYQLSPGDSLIFESYLPHQWQNQDDTPAQMLLVLVPTDVRDRPAVRHFQAAP